MLRMRRGLQEKLGIEINSFSAVDPKGRSAAPLSLPHSSADNHDRSTMMPTDELFGGGAGMQKTAGSGQDHGASSARPTPAPRHVPNAAI
eukprot:7382414-Prymnesium_polylepis.1